MFRQLRETRYSHSGGFQLTFDNGYTLSLYWRNEQPHSKEYKIEVVESPLAEAVIFDKNNHYVELDNQEKGDVEFIVSPNQMGDVINIIKESDSENREEMVSKVNEITKGNL